MFLAHIILDIHNINLWTKIYTALSSMLYIKIYFICINQMLKSISNYVINDWFTANVSKSLKRIIIIITYFDVCMHTLVYTRCSKIIEFVYSLWNVNFVREFKYVIIFPRYLCTFMRTLIVLNRGFPWCRRINIDGS